MTEIEATQKLFEKIKMGLLEPYISPLVIEEIEKCSDPKLREKMLRQISL
ncbi:MAG: hypothetical protein QME68_02095 [Elusimicrobiota bacterium]|nr:hypothetical protein [Elusimicrobiota bacterium]